MGRKKSGAATASGVATGRVLLRIGDGAGLFRPGDRTRESRNLAERCDLTVASDASLRERLVAAVSRDAGRQPELIAECGPDGFNGDDIGAVLLLYAESGGELPPAGVRRVTAVLRFGQGSRQNDRVDQKLEPTRPADADPGDPLSGLDRPGPASPAERMALAEQALGELKAGLLRRREESAVQLRRTLESLHNLVREGDDAEANQRLVGRLAWLAELAGCRLVVKGTPVTLRYHLNVFQARSVGKPQKHVASGKALFPISAEPISSQRTG